MLDKLKKLSHFLDSIGQNKASNNVLNLFEKTSKEKWMQEATNPREKGELHRKLNIPKDEKIPTTLLEKEKKRLQNLAKGDAKLSKSDRETLSQIIFALNARK